MSEPGPLPAGPQPARDAYARARQMRVEKWIDEMVPMSDQVIGQEMCVVTATRNGIDVRKWIASKLRPHQYGDQPTGVTVTNQSNVVLISEERQRELQAVRQRMIEQQKKMGGGQYPSEGAGGSLAGRSRVDTGVHPIVPIMIGDAAKSQKFAGPMLEKGVYVIGFFYPVVPHATARVRTQRIRAKIWNLPSTPLPKQTKS